jgi:predicted dehydrogenase
MDRPLRVACVGAGYFSRFHHHAWRSLDGVTLAALCDRDRARADAAAAQFGIARVFTDFEAMLDAVEPALVDIVTPPASQAALVAAALSRRIPVICQKPFGTDFADALRMTAAAREHGVPLVVHENIRWSPWYREAWRLIADGRLGRLHAVAFRLRPGDGQGADAYASRQPYFRVMPRLLVVETAIHWIDTFRFLMGEVAAVYARLRRVNPAIAGEDAGYLLLEFETGATGLFDGNRLNDHVASDPRRTMGEMWLEGSRGVLRLDGEARLWWKDHHGAEREHAYDRGPADTFAGGACIALQRHVVDHVVDGSPLENSAQAYLANLAVQEALYRSHAEGRRIEMNGFDPTANPAAAATQGG